MKSLLLAATMLAAVVLSPASHAAQTFYIRVPGLRAAAPVVASGVIQNGATRTWSDGTVAASCNAYLSGAGGHSYSGATGDGTYRVGLQNPTDVYCDMTTDGGGWTLVMNAVASAVPGNWTTATGAVNASTLTQPSATTTGKLADTDIQSLTHVALRVQSASWGMHRFIKPTCQYVQTLQPTSTNGCFSTYSTTSWSGEQDGNDSRGIATGIQDGNLSTNAFYISTCDQRGYGWFVGSGQAGVYAAAQNYGTPVGFTMWAK